jgi:hypothetical protein
LRLRDVLQIPVDPEEKRADGAAFNAYVSICGRDAKPIRSAWSGQCAQFELRCLPRQKAFQHPFCRTEIKV